jgi:hypothetical protein
VFFPSGLKSLRIPAGVQFIDGRAIQSVGSRTVASTAGAFKVARPFLIDCVHRSLVRYLGGDSASVSIQTDVIGIGGFERFFVKSVSIAVDNSVQLIDQRAFARTPISSVFISRSVTVVGQPAFRDCRLLQSVDFGESSRLHRIEELAFTGTAPATAALPRSVVSIGSRAFPWSCAVEMAGAPPPFAEWRAAAFTGGAGDPAGDFSAFAGLM